MRIVAAWFSSEGDLVLCGGIGKACIWKICNDTNALERLGDYLVHDGGYSYVT